LNAEVAGLETKYYVALRLGGGTPLADRIRQASDNEIETDDLDGQLAFVQNDLGESPMLLALRPGGGADNPRLVLRGHYLSYQIREYRQPRQQASPTWEFACWRQRISKSARASDRCYCHTAAR
jgi:hypothetical protein